MCYIKTQVEQVLWNTWQDIRSMGRTKATTSSHCFLWILRLSKPSDKLSGHRHLPP